MAKYKGKYRIESNRAYFWDYSLPADYFITICTANRASIFGGVENGRMVLSDFGEIVKLEILKMPQYHKRVIIDEWVVMPNHIHLIITLGDYGFDNGAVMIGGDGGGDGGDGDGGGGGGGDGGGGGGGGGGGVEKIHEFSLPGNATKPQWWENPNHKPTINEIKQYRKQRRKMVIPKILGKLKQQTSKQINILRNTPGMKNWQANYHDHIIREARSYHNIKNYIINNPAKWSGDKFNPNN